MRRGTLTGRQAQTPSPHFAPAGDMGCGAGSPLLHSNTTSSPKGTGPSSRSTQIARTECPDLACRRPRLSARIRGRPTSWFRDTCTPSAPSSSRRWSGRAGVGGLSYGTSRRATNVTELRSKRSDPCSVIHDADNRCNSLSTSPHRGMSPSSASTGPRRLSK